MTVSKNLVLLIGALGSACITSMVSAQPAAPQHTPAQAVTVGNLVIEQPWIRATPGGAKVAGGYLRITNRGSEPDRLVGVSIPLAERGEVHELIREGEVMKMQPVQGGIEIKPGQTVELKPGGYHLMFLDLKAGAKEGDAVPGSLSFEKAGTAQVTFPVAGMGAQVAPAEHSR
jgi:copper(I)-binding protein